MFLIKCLRNLIILLNIAGTLAIDCKLNSAQLNNTRIMLVESAGKLDLLHTDYIKNQTTLHLACNKDTPTILVTCNNGQFQQGAGSMGCTRRLKSTIKLMDNEVACRNRGGEKYQIQYELPDQTILPIYQVCYSKNDEFAVFSKHNAYGFDLTASGYERPQFVQGGIVSKARAESFERVNVYNRFIELLGEEQTYVKDNKTLIIDRGHLANSQDFLTYDQMDETFKLANVMPQFSTINRSNWKRIENWIHKLPAANTYASVFTTSFDILSLPHSKTENLVPMYLQSPKKNAIPLWMVKAVKYDRKYWIFTTLNNPYADSSIVTRPTFCTPEPCPANLIFTTEVSGGISYCCNYNYFVRISRLRS